MADPGWRYPYALLLGHRGDRTKRERRDGHVSDERSSSDRSTLGGTSRDDAMAYDANPLRAELRKLERGGDPLSSPRGHPVGLPDHPFRIERTTSVSPLVTES